MKEKKLYIARDKDGTLKMFTEQPERLNGFWNSKETCVTLPPKLFTEINWNNLMPFEFKGIVDERKIIKETPIKELFIEIDSNTGIPFTPKEQENGIIFMSDIKKATDKDKEDAIAHYNKYGECKCHLVYDTPSWIYNERRCYICGKFVGVI
jgi:hypothetical protein